MFNNLLKVINYVPTFQALTSEKRHYYILLFQSHHVIHESERIFACEVCSYASRRMESLRVHMRIHESVKPFQCGVCHKQYTQKYALEVTPSMNK